jgi:hypothetical protein
VTVIGEILLTIAAKYLTQTNKYASAFKGLKILDLER